MIGKKIYEARKLRGLSQEELSEQSKLSVRTLQRIENDENVPRGKTLNLLCDVLDIKIEELQLQPQPKSYAATSIHYFFLIILNLLIMTVFGYLTMDSEANFNSKLGAVVLGFFMSYFIVTKTSELTGTRRLLMYGSGMIAYIILGTVRHPYPPNLLLGFYPSIGIFISVLFYGNHLIKVK